MRKTHSCAHGQVGTRVWCAIRLLQVSADDFDKIIGGVDRGLILARHVIADVVFH